MIPTSVFAQVNTISYYERLKTLPETSILKAVFNEQRRLHHLGFRTWYGRVWELARNYGLDLAQDLQKSHIQETLINSFKQKWASDINDISMHPLLQTYRLIKIAFKLEPYLSTVSNYRYRNALTRLRTSSHTLQIERGRHTRPITPVNKRLCANCYEIEDEFHFLIECKLYSNERNALFDKICRTSLPDFVLLDNNAKFVYLLTCEDPQTMSLIGKFIYYSFQKRVVSM